MNLRPTMLTFFTTFLLSEAYGQFSGSQNYDATFSGIGNYFDETLRVRPRPIPYNNGYNSRPVPPSYIPFSMGNVEGSRLPLCRPVNLFTPNTIQQPAETKGQIDMYNKDMMERQRELAMERSMDTSDVVESGLNGNANETGNSGFYVNVNSNGFNYNYSI